MQIETRKLGLAAYIKMQGGALIECAGRVYKFESDRAVEDWEVEYLNSCCHRHDTELINLRKLLR